MALQKLSDLPDYEIAEGSPDIRGWQVVDDTGNLVGRVVELYADPDTEVIDYAGVRVNSEVHVVPLDSMDFKDNVVHLHNNQDILRGSPSFDPSRDPHEYDDYWSKPAAREEVTPREKEEPELTRSIPRAVHKGISKAEGEARLHEEEARSQEPAPESREPHVQKVVEEKRTIFYDKSEE